MDRYYKLFGTNYVIFLVFDGEIRPPSYFHSKQVGKFPFSILNLASIVRVTDKDDSCVFTQLSAESL